MLSLSNIILFQINPHFNQYCAFFFQALSMNILPVSEVNNDGGEGDVLVEDEEDEVGGQLPE